jgi:hypothetical protein
MLPFSCGTAYLLEFALGMSGGQKWPPMEWGKGLPDRASQPATIAEEIGFTRWVISPWHGETNA